jgi:hypothetical protein
MTEVAEYISRFSHYSLNMNRSSDFQDIQIIRDERALILRKYIIV